MARKQFLVATEPHVAEVGDIELEFVPEIDSAEFLDAYAALQEQLAEFKGMAAKISAAADGDTAAAMAALENDPAMMRTAAQATRNFVASFMLDKSRDVLLGVPAPDGDGWQVKPMRLPGRVLNELVKWLIELYTGRPTGSASGSRQRSSKAGTRSTGSSRSKG